MDFVIVSNAATDIVGVGADRAEVRRALGSWQPFRRAPLSGESDQFVKRVSCSSSWSQPALRSKAFN